LNLDAGRPVAGYYRISVERDGMLAPEVYERQIREHCAYKKLHLHEPMFSDIGVSGSRAARSKRKGLDELLSRRQEFSAVVVPRLNRFGRSLVDLSELFETFDNDDIGLIFLDLEIDTRTATGKLVRNIMATLAEWEADRLSESWKQVHQQMASEGRSFGGGATPYGYQSVSAEDVRNGHSQPQGYYPDPESAPIVQEIFERYLRGDNLHAIAGDLRDREVPTRSGGRWHHTQVRQVLDNPAYIGVLRRWEYKNEKVDGKTARKRTGNYTDTEAAWEPLIDDETWRRVQVLRAVDIERTKKFSGAKGRGAHLLSGMIFCRACGRGAPHQGPYYNCPTKGCPGGSVPADRADREVTAAFLSRIGDEQVLNALRRPEIRPAKGEEDLRQQITRVTARMDRLVELALEDTGETARQSFSRKAKELEEKRAVLERQLMERRGSEVGDEIRVNDTFEFLADVARYVPEIWEAGPLPERALLHHEGLYLFHADFMNRPVAEQREALKLLIERIEIVPGTRPKELDVKWHDVKKSVRLKAPVAQPGQTLSA
jgi:site-specific DNA recombinase